MSFLEKLGIFQKRPELLASGEYKIRSDVSAATLDLFLSRVFGTPSRLRVSGENVESLRSLCDEMGFAGFDDEIEAVLREDRTKFVRELGLLRERVDEHDLVVSRVDRQVRAFQRQFEAWRSCFERRLEEISRESQRRLESLEKAFQDEIGEDDVRGQIGSFVSDIAFLKREVESLDKRSQTVELEVPATVDACERSVSILLDEVASLKEREARLTFESVSFRDKIADLYRCARKSCVFSWQRSEEVSLGKKMVVVRKSTSDIYAMLDPDSTDDFGSGSSPGAWIEIEFKAPVLINGLKVTSPAYFHGKPKTFDVTFSDGVGCSEKYKVSFVDEAGLNGKNLSVERRFDTVSARLVRIESRGPSWDGSNFFNIGGFELFSPEEALSSGVFHSIFSRCRGHVWDVFDVRARNSDGRELHIPNNRNFVCTMDGEYEWVEIGFLHGRVTTNRYRIQKDQDKIRDWSLRGSNDRNASIDDWTVLHRHREVSEAEKTSKVLEFECSSHTPFRFFRVVQEQKNWSGKLMLSLKHFDIDGVFIPD